MLKFRKNSPKASSILTLFIVLSVASAFVGVHVGKAQNSTNVIGIIGSDTTWTKANSPYILTGPTRVNSGVTLAIEPGAIIDFENNYLEVDGTLYARGSTSDHIVLIASSSNLIEPMGKIRFMDDSTDWNETRESGSIIENAVLDAVLVDVIRASPKINNNIFAGGYFNYKAIGIGEGSKSIVSNNIIDGRGSGFSVFEGGIGCSGDAFISRNIVFGWQSIGIQISGGSPIVEGNLVVNNTGSAGSGGGGFRIEWSNSKPIIRNNTITKNSVGINLLNGPWPTIVNNNIQDNINWNICGATDNTIGNPEHNLNATWNWWGTTNSSLIAKTIKDNKNDYNLGSINYIPFLTEPNPAAPSLDLLPSTLPLPEPLPTPVPSNSSTAIPTQISISIDASSASVGSAVNIHGKLTDINAKPLTHRTIVLSYNVAGNTLWIPIGSSNTNANGEYNIQWVNTASGIFTLKAEFIGNTDYHGAKNTVTLSFLPFENQNIFLVESNSTVSSLVFNSTSSVLSFTVSGTSGTRGYVKVTIAKSLIPNAENIQVYLDGNQLGYTVASNADFWMLIFNYEHSSHEVRINLATNNIGPLLGLDYWMWIAVVVAAAFAIGIISGLIIWKKKERRPENLGLG